MKLSEYKRVKDNDIQLVWACPECKAPNHFSPDWFTINGTPVCDCGQDMEFRYAEVRRKLMAPPEYRTVWMLCPSAKVCGNKTCLHAKPHPRYEVLGVGCKDACGRLDQTIRCVRTRKP